MHPPFLAGCSVPAFQLHRSALISSENQSSIRNSQFREINSWVQSAWANYFTLTVLELFLNILMDKPTTGPQGRISQINGAIYVNKNNV